MPGRHQKFAHLAQTPWFKVPHILTDHQAYESTASLTDCWLLALERLTIATEAHLAKVLLFGTLAALSLSTCSPGAVVGMLISFLIFLIVIVHRYRVRLKKFGSVETYAAD